MKKILISLILIILILSSIFYFSPKGRMGDFPNIPHKGGILTKS